MAYSAKISAMTRKSVIFACCLVLLVGMAAFIGFKIGEENGTTAALQWRSDAFVLGANDHGHWISSRARIPLGDKVEVPCRATKNTAVLLIFGQSNASNESKGPHKSGPNVQNFSYIDGKCYRAEDPLVGASGIFGSFASRLGDLLVDRGEFDSVVLVPMAIGGSFIEDWAPGGQFHRRLLIAIAKLRNVGMDVTHFLFHQGESDAAVKTDPKLYQRRFLEIVSSLRGMNAQAPVYIAVATICGGPAHPEIRDIQRSLPNPEKGILPGPDTDMLGQDFRFDGCHFSAKGLDRHADMWLRAITKK